MKTMKLGRISTLNISLQFPPKFTYYNSHHKLSRLSKLLAYPGPFYGFFTLFVSTYTEDTISCPLVLNTDLRTVQVVLQYLKRRKLATVRIPGVQTATLLTIGATGCFDAMNH